MRAVDYLTHCREAVASRDFDDSPRRRGGVGKTWRMPGDAKVVWGLALSVVLWLVAGLFTAWLVHDLLDPESACESSIPWFEGLSLERAEVGFPPPLIRCHLVDNDASQLGERAEEYRWSGGEVLLLLVLDLAAIGEAVRRLSRQRQRAAPAVEA